VIWATCAAEIPAPGSACWVVAGVHQPRAYGCVFEISRTGSLALNRTEKAEKGYTLAPESRLCSQGAEVSSPPLPLYVIPGLDLGDVCNLSVFDGVLMPC
jgi:hypothetical protein